MLLRPGGRDTGTVTGEMLRSGSVQVEGRIEERIEEFKVEALFRIATLDEIHRRMFGHVWTF